MSQPRPGQSKPFLQCLVWYTDGKQRGFVKCCLKQDQDSSAMTSKSPRV